MSKKFYVISTSHISLNLLFQGDYRHLVIPRYYKNVHSAPLRNTIDDYPISNILLDTINSTYEILKDSTNE